MVKEASGVQGSGLYYKGFCLSESEICIKGFNSTDFCGLCFSYDTRLEVEKRSFEDFSILIAGSFIDIRNGSSDINNAADNILRSLVNRVFYEEIDYYSGSYIVVVQDPSGLRLLNDATGMRSVFYTNDFKFIASHCDILRDFGYGQEVSDVELYRRELPVHDAVSYKFGYPGFYTKYNGCMLLPPNFELNVKSGLKRFFPRDSLDNSQDINDVIMLVNQYMINQKKAISSKGGEVYCALTSGVDSRFLLTAMSSFDNFKYFTYCYSKKTSYDSDVSWASVIANALKLKHYILSSRTEDELSHNHSSKMLDFVSSSIDDSFLVHTSEEDCKFIEKDGVNSILIRSDVCKIGRSFYHDKFHRALMERKISEENMSEVFLYLYDERLMFDGPLKKCFSSYSQYLPSSNIVGYDFLDLFYWEHCLGSLNSQMVNESKFSFETFDFCNSREVIKLLLSVPIAERQASEIFKKSVIQYLPEIKDIEYNKKIENPSDTFHVNSYIEDSCLFASTSVSGVWNDPSFAYYVYLDGQRIATRWYSADPFFSFNVESPGSYRIKVFVKTPSKQPVSKYSRTIKYFGYTKKVQLGDVSCSQVGISEGRNDFVTDNYVFQTLFKKGCNDKLIVLLNGAVGDRSKVNLPVFNRNSWGVDVDDHVLNVNDPTLDLETTLRIGWYYGTLRNPVIPELRKLVLEIACYLGVKTSDILIYGSSGGGFASLALSACIGGGSKAVAINPQIYIEKYIAKAAVENFFQTCVTPYLKSPVGQDNTPSVSIDELLSNAKESRFLIYQNTLDKHHYNVHFLPLLEYLRLNEVSVNDKGNFEALTFEDSRGHVGEKREDFLKLIEIARSV